MGLLRDEGVIYKAVNEVDVSPESDHVYVKANVKGSISLLYNLSILYANSFD